MPELAASEELPWTQVCTRKNPYKMPTLPKPQTVNKNNTSANTAELKEPHNNKIKELMTTVKCPLKNIMYGKKSNREIYLQKINDTALVINKIIIHTCQFLNLFLVHKFQQGHTFPEIDELCIKAIIKTITKVDHSNGGHPKQKYLDLCAQFKDFHKQHFKICDPEIVDNYKNTQILSYEAKSIVTHIKNNIEEHFFDYVNKFVNQSFNVADKIKKINEQTKDPKMVSQLRYELNTKYRKIKADLVSPSNDYVSDVKYHKWIKKHKSHILHKNTFLKDSVAYDIACNQLEYLPALFYINNKLEKLGKKIFHVIPQRSSIVPKYITLDTTILVNLFEKRGEINRLKNAIKKNQDMIWKKYFKAGSSIFRKTDYQFDFMITTDGVGASILFKKIKDGIPIKIMPSLQRNIKTQIASQNQYIEKVKITENMKKKKLVAIDPNLSDLMYCVSKDDNGKIQKFRYTQAQRRLETRNKKYNDIIDNIKKNTVIRDGKTVKNIEAELSNDNGKSVNIEKLKAYYKKKNQTNNALYGYYSDKIHLKLKMNRYINTQKSESKMLKNFQKKFGEKGKLLVVIGDYDKQDNFKGKESVICRRTKKILRKGGFEIYLINEFRTSKLCNVCENECKKFHKRETKKSKTENQENDVKNSLVWGLVRCENVNCGKIFNRDTNAAMNMYKIGKNVIAGLGRPAKYSRIIPTTTSAS